MYVILIELCMKSKEDPFVPLKEITIKTIILDVQI